MLAALAELCKTIFVFLCGTCDHFLPWVATTVNQIIDLHRWGLYGSLYHRPLDIFVKTWTSCGGCDDIADLASHSASLWWVGTVAVTTSLISLHSLLHCGGQCGCDDIADLTSCSASLWWGVGGVWL